jgi:hypothetical protein
MVRQILNATMTDELMTKFNRSQDGANGKKRFPVVFEEVITSMFSLYLHSTFPTLGLLGLNLIGLMHTGRRPEYRNESCFSLF